ncbi:MAG: hypothetical protein RXO36_06370 [Candidatus Nanopusillus acidilobi]
MEDIAQANIEVVLPNVAMAKQAMAQFEQIKTEILNNDTDIIMIEGKKYIKRSGWRKIALAFNVTTEIVKIEREKIDDVYIVRVIARAIAPNGRISEEVGICDSTEFQKGRLKFSYHNIETKATTRAINRSISNLVGGGELSAEEIIEGPEEKIEERSETPIDKAFRAVEDFFETKNIDIEIQKDDKKITVLADIPNNIFNELITVLKRYNISYLGRRNGGGSYWGISQ